VHICGSGQSERERESDSGDGNAARPVPHVIWGSAGFTLIELLVSIAIVSLLSSVVLASIQETRRRAGLAALKQQVNAIEEAMVQYELNEGEWPEDEVWESKPDFVPENLPRWPEGPACLEYDYNYHTYFGDSGPDVGVSVHKVVDNSREPIAHQCFTDRCWADHTKRVAELDSFSCD